MKNYYWTGDIYRLHQDRKRGDLFCDDFATLEEARDYGEGVWNHLTAGEKRNYDLWIEKRTADLDEEEDGEYVESLFDTEGDLMEWGDSISWCTPYEVFTTSGDRVLFCSGPHFCIDGDWSVHDLAQAVQGYDYDPDRGYTDEELIRQEADILSGGCRECPFFSVCDAMKAKRD